MTTSLCGYCGRPAPVAVMYDGIPYHAECTRSPQLQYAAYPFPHEPGCVPLRQLTEEDVRRIVREELQQALNL